MRWFGSNWHAPICLPQDHTVTPVGRYCTHCEEAITPADTGVILNDTEPWHRECFSRSVIGSVAHQLKTCSCFVKGSTESDPPELTLRQAARLACELFKKNHP